MPCVQPLTFGSLFSGIGGFDLGLERAGWTCRWQVERDAFCQRVLAKHWPQVARYGDIETLDLERLERVDLICGGAPCQPISIAGKKRAQADDRWLWPEFVRVIRALRPRFTILENPAALLSANSGSAFGEILGDLAASGYDAVWDCIPAAALGAPHLRDRVWLVGLRREFGALERVPDAEHDGLRLQRQRDEASERADEGPAESRDDGGEESLADAQEHTEWAGLCAGEPGTEWRGRSGDGGGQAGALADADRAGREERRGTESVGPEHAAAQRGGEAVADADRAGRGELWFEEWQSQLEGASGDEPDGCCAPGSTEAVSDAEGGGQPVREWTSRGGRHALWGDLQAARRELGVTWAVEPDVGRVVAGVPARVDRLRALGNSLVPQIAQWLGEQLKEIA